MANVRKEKKMKLKQILFIALLFVSTSVLSGCELVFFDHHGPQAKIISDTIILSILVMLVVVIVVWGLFAYMIYKFRASKMPEDYEPPHIEGSKTLEIVWTAIPILIIVFLSIVTVVTTAKVESVPDGYEDSKPLVIYASSSDWKWHFSYPEEGIETVNYVNIPVDRNVEFRLYSFGSISSFWIPQLYGQKYAMSDMITTINLVAEDEGSYMGKNSNFSGRGFADQEFEVLAQSPADYTQWIQDVRETAPELTESKFDELLETDFVGRESYSSTHLDFRPAPTMNHDEMESDEEMDHDMESMDHSEH